ncbi:MAG: glutathione-disulfide reductase [Kofleriaceae bacterium]
MTRFDVDLFVLGGGSGGVRAGRVAAEHGARVAIAEQDRWGGTCVVRGCVPKKLLVYASETSRTLDDARHNGWTIEHVTHDWATFVAAKDREITRLSQAYRTRLEKAGVRVLTGRAVLADAHTIEVGGQRITAANILVAVGGQPKRPGPGWITSDEAFHLPALPKRIAILGGGYIGVEFAHIFQGLGATVTLIHRDVHVLRGWDPEVRELVTANLSRSGIDVVHCSSLSTRDACTTLIAGDREIPTDLAMAAIGREPSTSGIGLDAVGVALDHRGAIVVDEWSRSSVPHIYAVGDVTGRVALTPVAIREGHAVADTLFGNRPTPIHHHLIPSAVFGQPPAASVGYTEPGARSKGHEVHIYRAKFRPMRYALSGRDEHVLIKLVVDRDTDKVLGLHMVGVDAPEIVQTAAIAITMGATKADFDRTFALHPTTAEELVLLR